MKDGIKYLANSFRYKNTHYPEIALIIWRLDFQ